MVAMVITAALCLIPLERFAFLNSPLESAVTNVATGALLTGLAFCPIVIFAYWFVWKQVATKRRSFRASYSVAGVLSLCCGTMYKMEILGDRLFIALSLPLLIWLYIFGRQVMQSIVDLVPLREVDYRAAFPIFPPRERLDLIRLDCILGLTLAIPVLGRWVFPGVW